MKNKIARLLLPFLCLTLCSTAVFGQRRFRAVPLTEGGVEFILPPKSNLKLKDNQIQKKYQCHFIRFVGMKGASYMESLEKLDETVYSHGKREDGKANGADFNETAITGCNFCAVKEDANDFVLRLDYEKVLEDGGNWVKAFNQLGRDLLVYFAARETKFNWSPGISQSMVEKVFELVPVPQESSFARFGFESDVKRTVLPLSPKFSLLVDVSVLVPEGNEKDRFALVGQSRIYLFRRQPDGGTAAFLEQRPFLKISKNAYPNNYYSMPRMVLLSSSADAQLSSSINKSTFVAFYEGIFKQNNSVGAPGTDPPLRPSDPCNALPPSDYCIGRRNSYLLFSDNVNEFYEQPSTEIPPDKPIKGAFGERSLITPLISVTINDAPLDVPVNVSASDLIQSGKLPPRFRLQRVHRGRLTRFDQTSPRIILLPGDRLSF